MLGKIDIEGTVLSHILINRFNVKDKAFFRYPTEKAKGEEIQGSLDFSSSLPNAREK